MILLYVIAYLVAATLLAVVIGKCIRYGMGPEPVPLACYECGCALKQTESHTCGVCRTLMAEQEDY